MQEIISKLEAKSLGLKRYFTGKPCAQGHLSERQTSKSTCLECKRLSSIKSRAKGAPDKKQIAMINSEKTGIPIISRQEAIIYGYTHYFTGIPCRNGHIEKRTVSGFSCLACSKNNASKWREKNHEAAIATQRRFRNGDAHSKYRAKLSTKAKRRSSNAERKRGIRGAMPGWECRSKISKYYEEAVALNLTVDHIVPIKSEFVCGLHCCENFQMLDVSSNSSKGNRYWPDMPNTKDPELLKLVEEFKSVSI